MKKVRLFICGIAAMLLDIPAFAETAAEITENDGVAKTVIAYLEIGGIMALIFVVLLLLDKFKDKLSGGKGQPPDSPEEKKDETSEENEEKNG